MTEIIDAKIVDLEDNCFIVSTDRGTYKLPESIGADVSVEHGQLLQIDENVFLRLNIFESQETPPTLTQSSHENITEEAYLCGENDISVNDRFNISKVLNNPTENSQIPDGDIKNNIWKSSRTPTEEDINATVLFLELRTSEKYQKLFNDKKTIKSKIWEMIARDMKSKGFNVGLGKEASERCRQKCYNLQKTYISIMKESKHTGAAAPKLPKYFDLLQKLFGNKHSINPTFVIDSLSCSSSTNSSGNEAKGTCKELSDQENVTQAETSSLIKQFSAKGLSQTATASTKHASGEESLSAGKELSQKSTPSSAKRHFETVVPKPKSNADKIIETIRELHKKQAEITDRHFTRMENLLQEQNSYKKEFLNLFKTMKRKRSPSPDSD